MPPKELLSAFRVELLGTLQTLVGAMQNFDLVDYLTSHWATAQRHQMLNPVTQDLLESVDEVLHCLRIRSPVGRAETNAIFRSVCREHFVSGPNHPSASLTYLQRRFGIPAASPRQVLSDADVELLSRPPLLTPASPRLLTGVGELRPRSPAVPAAPQRQYQVVLDDLDEHIDQQVKRQRTEDAAREYTYVDDDA